MTPYKEKKCTVKITVDGKPYWVRGDTPEQAREKATLKKARLEAGVVFSRDMLVKDWADQWVKTDKEGQINDRYLSDIKGVIEKRIKPAIGYRKIKSVRPIELQNILNDLTGKSDSYIKKVKDILKGMFREAYNNDLIEKDPAKGLKAPKGNTGKRRAITDAERKLTLQVAEYSRGGLFVLIVLFCGLRPQEVAALRWSDIDMKKRIIHVSHAVKSDGSVGPPKSEAGIRDVPIPDYLYNKLAAQDHGPWDFVVTNTIGEHYNKSTTRQMWETFKRDMNIAAGCKVERNKVLPPYWVADDLTLYCYRHTYGTDLQAAGVPINVAKELLGHAYLSVTADIYTHGSSESFEDAREKITSYQASK